MFIPGAMMSLSSMNSVYAYSSSMVSSSSVFTSLSCSPPATSPILAAMGGSSGMTLTTASTRSITGKGRSTSCTRAGFKELVASKNKLRPKRRRGGGGDSGSDDEDRWQSGGGMDGPWGPIDGNSGGGGGGRGNGRGGSGSNDDWDSWMSRSGYSDGNWWLNLAMYDNTWAWQVVCVLSLLQALWFALPGRPVKRAAAAVV